MKRNIYLQIIKKKEIIKKNLFMKEKKESERENIKRNLIKFLKKRNRNIKKQSKKEKR